jgi:hypothetical protein
MTEGRAGDPRPAHAEEVQAQQQPEQQGHAHDVQGEEAAQRDVPDHRPAAQKAHYLVTDEGNGAGGVGGDGGRPKKAAQGSR